MGYSSKIKLMNEFNTMINSYRIIGLSLVVIIALIGIVNLVNVFMTSLLERRKEIATLQAIGMTENQLKYMLIMEEERYITIASIISIITSIICSLLIKQIIEKVFWFFDFRFTLIPAFALIGIYIIIGIIFPIIMYYGTKRNSITERIKVID